MRIVLGLAVATAACASAPAHAAVAHQRITVELDALKHACSRGDEGACRQYSQLATEIERKLPDRRGNHDADILLEKIRNGTLPAGPRDALTEQTWIENHRQHHSYEPRFIIEHPEQDADIAAWVQLASACTQGDQNACAKRDKQGDWLNDEGICFGMKDDAPSARVWHRCQESWSLRFHPNRPVVINAM